jgi:hypothetical protein
MLDCAKDYKFRFGDVRGLIAIYGQNVLAIVPPLPPRRSGIAQSARFPHGYARDEELG